ncbi:MAG: FkbM family methyltransferase [Dehalococcoidia bacterium]
MKIREKAIKVGNSLPASIASHLVYDGMATRMLRPLVNRVATGEFVEVVVRSGHAAGAHMIIDPKREKYYWTGIHEKFNQDMLASTLTRGMSYWDIGAHIGFFAIIASRLVGSTGTVHAFEPMPTNRVRLVSELSINKIQNVTVHAAILAEENGMEVIQSHGLSFKRMPEQSSDALDSEQIPRWTLDHLATMYGLPDVIKIDTEGMEVDILRGATSILREKRVKFVVEFQDEDDVITAKEVVKCRSFCRLSRYHWLID